MAGSDESNGAVCVSGVGWDIPLPIHSSYSHFLTGCQQVWGNISEIYLQIFMCTQEHEEEKE